MVVGSAIVCENEQKRTRLRWDGKAKIAYIFSHNYIKTTMELSVLTLLCYPGNLGQMSDSMNCQIISN